MDNLITPNDCERARLVCEKNRIHENEQNAKRQMDIQAQLTSMAGGINALVDLLPRLAALELWRARLNGKAEEVVRQSGYGTHRAGEQEDHQHQRAVDAVLAVIAAQKSEPFDIGKWLRINWKAVLVFSCGIIFLAALAGETLRTILEPAIRSAIGVK